MGKDAKDALAKIRDAKAEKALERRLAAERKAARDKEPGRLLHKGK